MNLVPHRQVIHNRGGPTDADGGGRVNFTRTWAEYREGFGDLAGDFWEEA